MSTQAIPKTMKAIQISKTGGPEVIEMNEIPVPTPQDNEVLVKVQWTGTNYIDTYIRSGLYPRKLPMTLGGGFVGQIVSLPKQTPPKTSLPSLEIGQTVLSNGDSAFAEYAVAPAHKVAPLPKEIDSKDGVHMSIPAFTAMYLVKESYEVKKGDWVLVRAAAGGVGLLLCQLVKYYGGNVIGTTSTPEKAEQAKASGADHVLLTTDSSESNVQKILDLTGGKGVHVVYDGVGKDTWEEDFLVVRTKGSIITYGNASGPVPAFEPLKLSPKCLKVSRPTLQPFINEPEDFAKYAEWIFDAVKDGGLNFSIYKTYPFTAEGVAQSQIDITSRKTTGKLLIKVSD